MVMWPSDDNERDRAIDSVAERLTAGEPGPRFTARVLERIDFTSGVTSVAPRPAWRSPWVWSPAAAAAVMIIAFGVFETVRPKPDTTSENTVRLKPVASATSATPETSAARAQTETGAAAVQALRPASAPTSARTDRRAPSELDPLAPARLGVNSIIVDALADGRATRPVSLDLEIMEPIAPIAVTPLTTAGENR